MKICFLAVGAFPHVRPYAEYLEKAGHEVRFFELSPGRVRKWRYPFDMLRARAFVRRWKPDLVHAHYATSGGMAALVCGWHPTIVTAHGSDLMAGSRSAVWRPLLRLILRRADCVNPVSEDLKRVALSLGVEPSKIRVLNPGIDTAKFSAGPRPALEGRPLRLICTRRLEPLYEPATIIEALARVKKAGAAFTMTFAGEGFLRPELERLVERLGLSAEVRFTGKLGGDEIARLLGEHDVYLSASRWDGASHSLLEAMASGVFPIVSDIPGNTDWIEDGAGGLLYPVGDAGALASLVLSLLQRPELAARAAALNRAKVLASGDRATNMRALESLYKELAA